MKTAAARAAALQNDVRISSRSFWKDAIWHLDGIRPGAAPSNFSINWDFSFCEDRFTDAKWCAWCRAAKTFLWSLKTDPAPGRPTVEDTSLVRYFRSLRVLLRWMVSQGHRRFADLDYQASQEFLISVATRKTKSGQPVKVVTLQHYHQLLALMYLPSARYPELAIADPLPGIGTGGRAMNKGWIAYTPDAIATVLVSKALRLLGPPADDVIALQRKAQGLYDEGLANGRTQTKVGFDVVDEIVWFSFSTLPGEDAPWRTAAVTSTKDVRTLIQRIYEACFVTVAYLVGARLSEILGLQVGCIEHHPNAAGDEQFAYLTGRIFKTSKGRAGKAHRWVAPPAVERAVAVMEQLTEPLRRRTGRTDLWLAMASCGLVGPRPRISVPCGGTIVLRLNESFAPFIDLPLHEGKPWHLNTHQGRKTFARFVAKRDRTGLHALQKHFGHVSLAMTDRGYVGTDFALGDLIDRHARDETRAALEELLTASALGGKGGRTIAGRSQFRGRTRDGDVQAYVDFLMAETDLRLGTCDWGYCVYREETSACHGNETGPNPVLRTESVCATCANFAVTGKHRLVWEARRAQNAELLKQPTLDPKSRELAQARIAECDRILVQLNQDIVKHGKK